MCEDPSTRLRSLRMTIFFIFGFDFTTQFHNVKGGTLPCDLVRDVRAAEIFVRLLLTLPPNLAIIKKLDFKEKDMTCL